jgi:hypothetical protein
MVLTVFVGIGFAGRAIAWKSMDAKTEAPELIQPCEEEVVYGTVVLLDETTGRFGLRGTQYEFVVDDPRVGEELEGMQVRIEVAADCSVRDLHVIGDFDSLTSRSTDLLSS